MPTFFQCKRRKIGLGLLIVLCWLSLLLGRSYWIEDFITFQSGPTTVDGLLVSDHRIMWARFRDKKTLSSSFRWSTECQSINPYTFFHRLKPRWHSQVLGFESAGYADRDEADSQFVFWSVWAVSYWSLILLLAPLSIGMICWPLRENHGRAL